MKVGYARVSTEDQNLALQRDALPTAGCSEIFEDQASGATTGHDGLRAAMDACASGGVLVVWKLDCLARSLLDLVSLAEEMKSSGHRPVIPHRKRGEHQHDDTGRPYDVRGSSKSRRIWGHVTLRGTEFVIELPRTL